MDGRNSNVEQASAMPLLTVFTPAYNRAHTLPRTYESLCRQTCRDFCWLVIDDGSTDGTRALVENWMAESRILINYIYQENQGMHGAHNTAYANIHTELNVCIDSDDWMPDDAVHKIVTFWQQHSSDKVAGIIGLDQTADGTVIGGRFPDEMRQTTLMGYYQAGGSGDKKLVYRTQVIQGYPEYPLFEGEKYVGLAYKYMLIDKQYELLTLNEPLVTVDYQPDGSSYSMYRQYWKNPRGFAFFRKTEMVCTPSLKRLFVVCTHYVSSSIMCRDWRFLEQSPRKLMTFVAIPSGIALYLFIRHQVKRNAKMNFK